MRGSHARHLCLAGDLHALGQDLLFVRSLHRAEPVEDRRSVRHLKADIAIADPPGEFQLRRERLVDRAAAQREGHPSASRRQRTVERRGVHRFGVAADRCPHQQAGDHFVELARPEDAVDTCLCFRLVLREERAGPLLSCRVAILDEQQLAPRLVARHQHEDGAFLRQARQVIEVAVLAVLVIDVERVPLRWRAPQDQHRVGPELFHHARSPRLEVVGELAGARAGGDREREEQEGRDVPDSCHRCILQCC